MFSCMGTSKALGTNGLSPFFFQRNWSVVSLVVCQFVKDAFLKGAFPMEINETLITWNPNQEHLKRISQFRLISLCNVVVKGIAKVVANILKTLMPYLIGEQQCIFVPGHQGIDIVVIVQEAVRKKIGKKG